MKSSGSFLTLCSRKRTVPSVVAASEGNRTAGGIEGIGRDFVGAIVPQTACRLSAIMTTAAIGMTRSLFMPRSPPCSRLVSEEGRRRSLSLDGADPPFPQVCRRSPCGRLVLGAVHRRVLERLVGRCEIRERIRDQHVVAVNAVPDGRLVGDEVEERVDGVIAGAPAV